VPWSRGRDFAPGDTSYDITEAPEDVRSALFVNLLTEDNLPYYTGALSRMYGDDGAWGTWARRWTAEEGRHSIVLRDYLTVTRMLDPIALERARMTQVERGQVPQPRDGYRGLVYVALQELATRVAHYNTGKLLTDPAGQEVMKRVAADENRHHLFYRDLATAAFEIDPSTMVLAVDHEVRNFEMPGTGIADFSRHAKAIARAGIYNFEIHYKQVLVPVVLRHWNLESLTGLTPQGERARESALHHIERIGNVAQRAADRRDAALASARHETVHAH
jgi:acyl-[acyl-carrier-protein] desaturase